MSKQGSKGGIALMPRLALAETRSPFAFDLRVVGLFRILFALVLLGDQCIRLADWGAFQSAAGIVSLGDSLTWDSPWVWSLYWLSLGHLLPAFLEALRLVATVALLLGVRARLAAFVLFVLLASLMARNPLLLQGGDKVLVVVAFFAALLPLGETWSLHRLWFGGALAHRHRSAATVAYTIQVLLVWFMAGVLKTGEQWWQDGTAISMALHLEAFASEFARLWRHWDGLLRPLTLLVFWIECLAPLLMLVPAAWCRLAGLLALIALEVGIWLSLEVGLFPAICLVALLPLVPVQVADLWVRWWRSRRPAENVPLTLFFDGDCRFCAFACRLLLACCGTRGPELRPAQSDPVAAAILEQDFAWSAVDAVQAPGDGPAAGQAARYRRGWAAVQFVVERSPRPWLARVLPGPRTGARFYSWLGRHRGALGAAGALAFGRNEVRGSPGRAAGVVAAIALAIVLAWNAATYPALRDRLDLRPWIEPLAGTLNLLQYWDMFAPVPYLQDGWHAMPGLSREGVRVDVLSGEPVSLAPPVDGPDRYGGYRWRKIVFRSLQRNEVERVLRHFCRQGGWAAFDLWEFTRPNLGVAATAEQPYAVSRKGRWQCDGVDMDAVKAFRTDVDAMMAGHRRRTGGDEGASG